MTTKPLIKEQVLSTLTPPAPAIEPVDPLTALKVEYAKKLAELQKTQAANLGLDSKFRALMKVFDTPKRACNYLSIRGGFDKNGVFTLNHRYTTTKRE